MTVSIDYLDEEIDDLLDGWKINWKTKFENEEKQIELAEKKSNSSKKQIVSTKNKICGAKNVFKIYGD